MGAPTKYSRFFTLMGKLAGAPDRKEIIASFTGGRTDSLKAMGPAEYKAMCDYLQGEVDRQLSGPDAEADKRRKRSAVLNRLQRLGINTADWDAVDNFCLKKQIAGKKFAALSIDELRRLIPKLESISAKDAKQIMQPTVVVLPAPDKTILN